MTRMKTATYLLDKKTHAKLWTLPNGWICLSICLHTLISCFDGILVGLKIVSWLFFWISFAVSMLLLSVFLLLGVYSEPTKIFGKVEATITEDGFLLLKADLGHTVQTRKIKPLRVSPFHSYVLVFESWTKYVFLTKEAASQLGLKVEKKK